MNASQRLQLANDTDYCVKWLKAQGLEVIGISQGHVTPIVTVRNSELCKDFEGRVQAFERGQRGAKRYSFVLRHGCEVRWAEPVDVRPRATLNPLRLFMMWKGGVQ